MPQKTFNIGECSYYGRWKIEIKGDSIIVTGIDWDSRKVMQTDTFTLASVNNYELENHLTDISTVYYAEQMMKWVKKQLEKNPNYKPRTDHSPWYPIS